MANSPANLSASELREQIRSGEWTGPTAGAATRYLQANLVIVEGAVADDFEDFCRANPKPCPLLERLPIGDPRPRRLARAADICRDIPRYRVYRDGALAEEVLDIRDLWRDDLVAFLTGCSFTFEKRLATAGIGVRHVECGLNVPMYKTSIRCEAVGKFAGPMVVSMRPIPMDRVAEAVSITGALPQVHGAPVHTGAPEAIGIWNIDSPDWGDRVPVQIGETPVFWACGVTPQAIALDAKLPFMITHSPGHMFVSDLLERYVEKTIDPPILAVSR